MKLNLLKKNSCLKSSESHHLGVDGFFTHPFAHFEVIEYASNCTSLPFDFAFRDELTEIVNSEVFDLVVDVTVTALDPDFLDHKSTVFRIFPLTFTTTLPEVGPVRNQTVIVRDFTEKLAEEPAVEETKLIPPIEPLVLTFAHGLFVVTAGTVVVVGGIEELFSCAISTVSDSA